MGSARDETFNIELMVTAKHFSYLVLHCFLSSQDTKERTITMKIFIAKARKLCYDGGKVIEGQVGTNNTADSLEFYQESLNI